MRFLPPRTRALRRAACVTALAASFSSPAFATDAVPQIAEDGAFTTPLTPADTRIVSTSSTQRLCQAGAQWLRLGFENLALGGQDSLTLTSSGGERLMLQSGYERGRSFHSRALRGDCVTVEARFSSASSHYRVRDLHYGTQALQASPVVVAGAGDICDRKGADCARTAQTIVGLNPHAVFTTGGHAEAGHAASLSHYTSSWGRFKFLTHPTPGTGDYRAYDADGYFDYFNGQGKSSGAAGDRGRGYYSWDVGEWHFVALNTMPHGSVSAAQLQWLKADLAANTKRCTAAYWHHPLVGRGDRASFDQVRPLWDALYAARADLVLAGHDHNYQRYDYARPDLTADANGLRQIVIGTGGQALQPLGKRHPLIQYSSADTHGVLKLTLDANGYVGEFVATDGTTRDRFTGTCHRAATRPALEAASIVATATTTAALAANVPASATTAASEYSVTVEPTSINMARDGSGSAIVTVTDPASTGRVRVRLSVEGLPAGFTAAFDANPVTANRYGVPSLMTVSAGLNVAPGTYSATVVGRTDDGTVRNAPLEVVVQDGGGEPTIKITTPKDVFNIVQGESGAGIVTIDSFNGNPSVTLSAPQLPRGVTATFSPNPVVPSSTKGRANSVVTLHVAPDAPPSSWQPYSIPVVATAGSASVTDAIQLNVRPAPSFKLVARQNAVLGAVAGLGISGWEKITLSNIGGPFARVSLAASGVPQGMSVRLKPEVVDMRYEDQTIQLTAIASAGIAPGTYPVTVTATAIGAKPSTVTIPLIVHPAPEPQTLLANRTRLESLTAAPGQSLNYAIYAPPSTRELSVYLRGPSDAVLRVRRGAPPTQTEYDCEATTRPSSPAALCVNPFRDKLEGLYFVSVTARSAFANARLETQYIEGRFPAQGQAFANARDMIVNDFGTAVSPIAVSGIEGYASSLHKVNVSVRHARIGDLKVELIAPNGKIFLLHDRTGGSTRDLIKSYSINASNILPNGVWRLRVSDTVAGDTGRLVNWSMRFWDYGKE